MHIFLYALFLNTHFPKVVRLLNSVVHSLNKLCIHQTQNIVVYSLKHYVVHTLNFTLTGKQKLQNVFLGIDGGCYCFSFMYGCGGSDGG